MNSSTTKSTTTATATKGKISSRKARDGKSTPPPLKVKGHEDARFHFLSAQSYPFQRNMEDAFTPRILLSLPHEESNTADILLQGLVCSCSQA